MSTKLFTLTVFLITLLLLPLSLALEDHELQTDCLYYFYGKECKDCDAASASLLALQTTYPNLRLEKYEVWGNIKNYEMMQAYFKAYGIEEDAHSIPVVFPRPVI